MSGGYDSRGGQAFLSPPLTLTDTSLVSLAG
jgi:hypothetical protein